MAYKKKKHHLLPKDFVMAYKKKKRHLLPPKDCVLAYKKKKNHLLSEDCIMTYKKMKHHLLPEDCFIEILLKLPIKSILKFKCVSKSWYAILVSSYFINIHMKLNEKKKLLFINNHRGKFLSFNLKDESIVSILNHCFDFRDFGGCCNGIICCCSDDEDIILLNPFTREFKVLPYFPRPLNVKICMKSVGFGFDNLNNDYKVILFLSLFHKKIRKGHSYTNETGIYSLKSNTWKGHSYTNETGIYSLKSNTWRKLENKNKSTTSKYVIPNSNSLFFNERVHWDAHDSGRHMILSMDISSEVFYEFQYPELVLVWIDKSYSSSYYKRELQVIRGSLSIILFHMSPNQSKKYIDIWSMKEYGVVESWSKQYTIGPFLSIMRALSRRENVMLTRVLSDEVEEEDHLLLQFGTDTDDVCKLVRWNLVENKEVQKYCHKDFHTNMQGLFYSQILISISKNRLDYI